jgi:hypothetical protein
MLSNNYDTWRTGYYEGDNTPDYECRECKDTYRKLDLAQGYMTKVLDMLYNDKALDILQFENMLDELCWSLDIKLRTEDLKLRKG